MVSKKEERGFIDVQEAEILTVQTLLTFRNLVANCIFQVWGSFGMILISSESESES